MLLHFLLPYLKTLSVGHTGVCTYGLVAQQTGVIYNDEKHVEGFFFEANQMRL